MKKILATRRLLRLCEEKASKLFDANLAIENIEAFFNTGICNNRVN